ncbi:helix-turn-helix domain-containing protein [Mesoterricola sediminis]|uniref:Helix-turn-helix domain-containing protein n=1 Tax=Mesoterricola sediminis TaxID=2927980 RepID=A0AA48H4P3_9BACT|nr:helix-turn-helix domain-containing protein [Mesoterricola sediminis]BDU77386.1 hypothetical protein METESE_23440 [Mesoterricola sediminis]
MSGEAQGAPPPGIGEALRKARLEQGISLYALGFDLNISVRILEAVEADAWEKVPPGRERPYARQIAERLGVDLEALSEPWSRLPGAMEQEPPDPRRERLERVLMGGLTAATILLVLWLVVPGRSLRRERREELTAADRTPPPRWTPASPAGPYPVVGEVLPEAPVNEEGVLVALRALDTCVVTIAQEQGQPPQARVLRISDPWQLRVKGPFSVAIDNAGVAVLDVAGRRIRHGGAVGEAWTGKFTGTGELIVPEAVPPNRPSTPPETDQEEE